MNQSTYKAVVTLAYCTGNPTWVWASGHGVAFSRSPKTAIRLAEQAAERQMFGQVGFEQGGLIVRNVTLTQGARLVIQEF